MSTLIFRYLKDQKETTIFWLGSILMWVLFVCDVKWAGSYLLICALGIFALILVIGQLKDRVADLQKQLDKFKI